MAVDPADGGGIDTGWDCAGDVDEDDGAVRGCCAGVFSGLLSGTVSGEDDTGTNCEPTFAGDCCDCNAIGAIWKVAVGGTFCVIACDPVISEGRCNGFIIGKVAVIPEADACGVTWDPVVESDCCNGAVSGNGFPAGWSACEVVCDAVVVLLFF